MVPRTTPETLKGLKSAAVGWLKPAICTAGQHRLSRETGEIAQSSVAECMSIMQKVLGSILGVGVEKFLEAHSYPLYELTGVWASQIPLWPLFPNEFFLVPDTEGPRAQLLPQQGLLAYLPHPLCHPPLKQDLAFSQFIFSSNNFPCHIKHVTLTITYFLILFPSLLSNFALLGTNPIPVTLYVLFPCGQSFVDKKGKWQKLFPRLCWHWCFSRRGNRLVPLCL